MTTCIHGDNQSECISCSMLATRASKVRPEANTKADSLRAAQEEKCLNCLGTKGVWIDRKDPRNPTYLQDNDADVFEECSECKGTGLNARAVHSKQSEPEPRMIAASCQSMLEAYRADIDKHSGEGNFDNMWICAESLLSALECMTQKYSALAASPSPVRPQDGRCEGCNHSEDWCRCGERAAAAQPESQGAGKKWCCGMARISGSAQNTEMFKGKILHDIGCGGLAAHNGEAK